MPSPITTDKPMEKITEGEVPEAIPPMITAKALITPSVPPYTADFRY